MANEKKIPPGICSSGTTTTFSANEISNRKPSCYGGLLPMGLPQPLLMEEKKYLLAVERGDIANVRRVLQRAHRKKHININCMDPLGRRALTLAIDSENLEMVELLVVMGVETKDSLLHAIDAEFVEAVELLLEHEELIYTEGDLYSWQKVDINTAMFAPDITPLILAAHKNNFEILKLLLDRGAAVPTPHDINSNELWYQKGAFPALSGSLSWVCSSSQPFDTPYNLLTKIGRKDLALLRMCGCEECVRHSTEDALRFSLARVNTYKALASPSFISLTSHDPLMTAFELSWDLRNLAFTEQECKAEYLELRRQCQQFAVDLLDQTRTSEELAIIINYDPAHSYEPGDRMTLSLLEQAISYKQKKFVAHPNVQQLLAAIWYQGLPGFRRKTEVQKVFKIVQVAIMFPLYCFIYMIAPNSNIGKLMRKPFMKFLIHASSYLFFLFILILVSQRAEDDVVRLFGSDDMIRNLEETSKHQRGNGPTKLELIVVCYLAGFLWEELQEIFNVGMKSYLRNMWNFIDFLRNGLYISVFCLRVFAYIDQRSEIEKDSAQAYIPREKWNDFDPQLIAEGLFAGANIFSALKLVHLFSINPHLGPLQISLGRMVIDIVKFFFIYTLVLFAFACGLNQLLWYFADLEKGKCYNATSGEADWKENGDSCMKWRRFGNLFESSQSLFWASFGMVGLENFELSGIKSYTRFWGLLMYGSYSVINVIVLLNLLIAMMSNSYAMIELHSDTEWKFARTKLWMSYFEDSSTLPPPFNVFPSIKWVIRLFRKSSKELARKKSQKRGENKTENRYASIMWSLVWRYVSANHRKLEQAPVTEDDINEVKADISTMRYELLEIFDSNGMDVSSAAKKEKPHRAKHAKIWERRLMRGFQVAPVPTPVANKSSSNNVNGEGDINEIKIESAPNQPPVHEDPKSRFRRIARTVANQSAVHKWNLVLQGVAKNSQIGRCCSKESYNSLQHLQKAIGEAKRLVLLSPPPHGTGCETPVIEFEDEKTSTLLDLLNKIGAELTGTDETNEDSDITNAKSVHELLEDVSSSKQATNPMPPDIHPVITEYGFISPPQSLKHDAVVAKESHNQQRKTPPVDTSKSTTTKSQNEVILSASNLGSSGSSVVGMEGAAELLLRNADTKMLAGKAIKKNPPPPAPHVAAATSASGKVGSSAAKSTPKPPMLSKLSSAVHPSQPSMHQDSFEVTFFEMDDAMEEMYSAGLTDSQSEASVILQPPPKPTPAPKSPYKRGTGRQGWF